MTDLLRQDTQGKGIINILDARKLINDPRLYCTFHYGYYQNSSNNYQIVGDLDKP